MPLIDDRGYLFGRLNLIDAAMVFVLLWCIPLGYGAFRLFRVPTPEIHGIQPATVVAAADMRLTIEGQNFRPYLRATVGSSEALFFVQSSTHAEVHVATELAPGTYDLVLLDIAQEVARRPDGVVVEAPPSIEIGNVRPEALVAGTDLRLTIDGQHFRPSLRATVGATEAQFLVESTTRAELNVPELAPGTYNLVLFDFMEEVARWPGIVVEAPVVEAPPPLPTHQLDVWGRFRGLDADGAKALARTRELGEEGRAGSATVLYLEPPQRELVHLSGLAPVGSSAEDSFEVSAHLRLRCALVGTECQVAGTTVAPSAVFPLAWDDEGEDDEEVVGQFYVSGIFPSPAELTAGTTTLEVVVRGSFPGLDQARAVRLSEESSSGPSGGGSWNRILALAPPVPEIVQLNGGSAPISGATGRFRVEGLTALQCTVLDTGCKIGSATLEPGAVLPIVTAAGVFSFQVARLYPAGTTLVDVTMRSAGDRNLLSLVRADAASYRANSPSGVDAWEPALVAVGDVEENANLMANLGGFGFEQPGALFSVVIRLRARQTATGWQYGTTPLRSGEPFEYSQSSYSLTGVIAGVDVAPQQAEDLIR